MGNVVIVVLICCTYSLSFLIDVCQAILSNKLKNITKVGLSNVNYQKFELQVRNELWKKDMTLTEFAEVLGITSQYLTDILKGRRKATEQRKKIKKILGIEDEK